MINDRDRFIIENFLINNNDYSIDFTINNNNVLRAFIKGLFIITDEYFQMETNSREKTKECFLIELREYVVNDLGENSKLVKDIDVEINNQSNAIANRTKFYDDLLKLRASIDWKD